MQPLRHSGSPVSKFKILLDEYEGFVRGAGKLVYRESDSKAHELFMRLGDEGGKKLLLRLENEMSIYREMMIAGEKLTDSPKLLWRFFARNGLTPCSDIFSSIADKDVVEIYGLNFKHVFVNLNFYDYISATLEEIFCNFWYEVVRRDQAIEKQLMDMAGFIAGGGLTKTMSPGIAKHIIEEIDTEKNFVFTLYMKKISPVYSKQQLDSFIVLTDCEHVKNLGV
jgi:hypothetical protein